MSNRNASNPCPRIKAPNREMSVDPSNVAWHQDCHGQERFPTNTSSSVAQKASPRAKGCEPSLVAPRVLPGASRMATLCVVLCLCCQKIGAFDIANAKIWWERNSLHLDAKRRFSIPEKSQTEHFDTRRSHPRRSTLPACSWRACAFACVCNRCVGRVDHFLTKALRSSIGQCNTDPEAHHSVNKTHIAEFYKQRESVQRATRDNTSCATTGKRCVAPNITATTSQHARTCLNRNCQAA